MAEAKRKFKETKLVDLCLKTIMDNFERFMAERASGKNVPSMCFDFLQIAYSQRLFEELAGTEYFSKYMDFFLNEDLKEIDLNLCHDSSDINQIFERLKIIGHKLTSLGLSNFHCIFISEDMLLELIPRMQNLKSLSIQSTDVTDSILQRLGKYCASLESLWLHACSDISDRGIGYLCSIREDDSICKNDVLKDIHLYETSVTHVGVIFILKNCPNVVELRHENLVRALMNIHADYLKKKLAVFPTFKLKLLSIQSDDKHLTSHICHIFALLCPDVTRLHVFQYFTLQSQIDAYTKFTNIQEVYFQCNEPVSFSPFIKCRGQLLKSLGIRDGCVSVENILQYCSRLKLLSLNDIEFEPLNGFNNDSLKYKLQNLELLYISEADLQLEHVKKSVQFLLRASTNLDELFLIQSKSLTFDFISSIVEYSCMKTLKKIYLVYSNVPEPTLKKILTATPYHEYSTIHKCGLSSDEIKWLQVLLPSTEIIYEHEGANNYFELTDD